MSAKKTIRMDRSKYFSTVHGERKPGDDHANVFFYQDKLPFNANGELVMEAVPEELKDAVERRIAKLNKSASAVPSVKRPEPADDDDDAGDTGGDSEGDDDDDKADENPSNGDDVNLEAWLRGTEKYQWFKVAAAIRDRYNRNVSNAADAVVFLVAEGLVPADQVADAHKKHLN